MERNSGEMLAVRVMGSVAFATCSASASSWLLKARARCLATWSSPRLIRVAGLLLEMYFISPCVMGVTEKRKFLLLLPAAAVLCCFASWYVSSPTPSIRTRQRSLPASSVLETAGDGLPEPLEAATAGVVKDGRSKTA